MIVPPNLESRFLEPQNWQWGLMENSKNKTLRFGTVSPKGTARANIVILPGRGECAEKYFETAHDLLKRDCSVWVMEWQGQGLSDRFLEQYPQRNHSISFAFHALDLRQFIHEQVMPNAPGTPLIMLAQSMGGNIGMHYLHIEPDIFQFAALCSPMLGILDMDRNPWKKQVVKGLSLLAAERYALGQKDWSEIPNSSEKVILSSDPVRRKILNSWLSANPELRIGGVTNGWAKDANSACDFLKKPDTLKKITLPCLVALGTKENLVTPQTIRDAVDILPNAKLFEISEAGHEILMERDSMRNQLLSAFDELALNT